MVTRVIIRLRSILLCFLIQTIFKKYILIQTPRVEIIRRAITRSVKCANISNWITQNSPTTDLVFHADEYLMKIRLGTSLVDILAVTDMGSDLTWIPSRPCPPWNGIECCYGLCHHDIWYADRLYTRGFLSTETMRKDYTTHSSIEIPSYIFGCGIDNGGYFGKVGSEVIGLGAGPESIVTQMGQLSMRKFSYCLNPIGLQGRVSHIHFGDWATMCGPEKVTVPLAPRQHASLYNITLEAFTIRRARIIFIGGSDAVKEGKITRATPVLDLNRQLELCFRKDRSLQPPSMVANFRGDDVPLKWYNTFVTTGPVTCLAFGVSEGLTSYGSLAQQDFFVGFDKMGGTLSFKPFDYAHAFNFHFCINLFGCTFYPK
uniref:Xylanase inhibitor N-terminal domain-containing protein n=1 Tax=Kalanchoe fedtschenkoi TaxID=63787 RepID=A0A7N0VJI3_KALFE